MKRETVRDIKRRFVQEDFAYMRGWNLGIRSVGADEMLELVSMGEILPPLAHTVLDRWHLAGFWHGVAARLDADLYEPMGWLSEWGPHVEIRDE